MSWFATFKKLVAQFKCGNFSTCDASRPGRPTTENIDQIHEIILKDCRISPTSIAQQLGISRERMVIINEDLDVWKIFAKFVTKCLNADHKRQWCQSSEQIGIFSARSKRFPVAIGELGRNLFIPP